MVEKLIFEKSKPGRIGCNLSRSDVPELSLEKSLPEALRRKRPASLPEVSEPDLVRHYTRLSHLNASIDGNFYPLGSCTMKYNPKVNEAVVAQPGFGALHPLQDTEDCQGTLEALYRLERFLCEIGGFDAFTLNPAAGAQGEFTGRLSSGRTISNKVRLGHKILVPVSAHGTNPASATLAGLTTVEGSLQRARHGNRLGGRGVDGDDVAGIDDD